VSGFSILITCPCWFLHLCRIRLAVPVVFL
jgi:hypothetical protein